MKSKAKVSNLPREILRKISLGVMTLSDMEQEVKSIRNKIGKIFMQKVVEAREKIRKVKNRDSSWKGARLI